LVFGALLLAGAAACSPAVRAQEKAREPGQEWAQYTAPGAAHQNLQRLAGTWTTTTRMWMDPSAPPAESQGTAVFEMILGGRWLRQTYRGVFMGQPFEGTGLMGYDNFKKLYVSSWSDNISTALTVMTGTANSDASEYVLTGLMDDPTSGEKDKKFKEILRVTSPDRFVFEMYDTVAGKGEVKVMEIVHVRSKE
jgi:hypothetical protein